MSNVCTIKNSNNKSNNATQILQNKSLLNLIHKFTDQCIVHNLSEITIFFQSSLANLKILNMLKLVA